MSRYLFLSILVVSNFGFYADLNSYNSLVVHENEIFSNQSDHDKLKEILRDNKLIPSSTIYFFFFDETDCSMCLDKQLLLLRSLQMQKEVSLVGVFQNTRNFESFKYVNQEFSVKRLSKEASNTLKQEITFPTYLKFKEAKEIEDVFLLIDDIEQVTSFLTDN